MTYNNDLISLVSSVNALFTFLVFGIENDENYYSIKHVKWDLCILTFLLISQTRTHKLILVQSNEVLTRTF